MSRRSRKHLWTAIAVISGAAALWFGVSLVRTLWGYRQGDEDLKQVYALMESISQDSDVDFEENIPDGGGSDVQAADAVQEEAGGLSKADQARLASYNALKELNGNVIGWVRIEDTVVNYPVMQTPDDPNYYLHHGFDGAYSSYGMIYMDAGCVLGESLNYVLYGHHMRNGSMFAELDNFRNEEYYKEHKVIHFDTLDELGEYEVAAVICMPASRLGRDFITMMAAETEESYGAFVDYVKENSFFDTGIVPQWPEQLLTLTTCEYTLTDGRLMVIARKIEE